MPKHVLTSETATLMEILRDNPQTRDELVLYLRDLQPPEYWMRRLSTESYGRRRFRVGTPLETKIIASITDIVRWLLYGAKRRGYIYVRGDKYYLRKEYDEMRAAEHRRARKHLKRLGRKAHEESKEVPSENT